MCCAGIFLFLFALAWLGQCFLHPHFYHKVIWVYICTSAAPFFTSKIFALLLVCDLLDLYFFVRGYLCSFVYFLVLELGAAYFHSLSVVKSISILSLLLRNSCCNFLIPSNTPPYTLFHIRSKTNTTAKVTLYGIVCNQPAFNYLWS